MLIVPFKKAPSVDLVKPITFAIEANYSQEDADAFKADIQSLQSLRNNAVGAASAKDQLAKTALLRYHAQLTLMEGHLPINDSFSSTIQVNFTWNDAFRPAKNAVMCNSQLERAGVLYNLGAMVSASAAATERTSDEGLKLACKQFQEAAGIFAYIQEKVVTNLTGAVTPDLSEQGLGMIKSLMLAQAQACFYEKAIRTRAETKMKEGVIARLAAQASEFYSATLNHARSTTIAENLDSSWPSHIEFQKICFEAAAEYWQSLAVKAAAETRGVGYGEEIARLQAAEALCAKALELEHLLTGTVAQTADNLKAMIARRKGPAMDDNRMIYLEAVPPADSLTPVGKAALVKPIEPTLDATDIKPLFSGLFPRFVMQEVESHKVSLRSMAEGCETATKEANSAARTALAEKGLPGSIAAHEATDGFPESVWTKVYEVQMKGADWALRSKMTELEGKAAETGEQLGLVQRVLDEEYANDDNFRIKHPTFQGVQSRDSGQHFQHDLAHYRQLWDQARSSDAALHARLDGKAYSEGMKLCTMSREQLDQAMPKPDEAEEKGVVAVAAYDTSVLSGELLKLAQLIQARDTLCAELSDACTQAQEGAVETVAKFVEEGNPIAAGGDVGSGGSDGPLDLAAGEPSAELSNLLAGITTEIAVKKDKLDQNIAEQGLQMQRIMVENDAFQAARSADAITLERERIVQGAENAAIAFMEMHAQLSEGVAFYTDLVGRLGQLLQTSEGYSYAQNMVREDFETAQGDKTQEASDAEMARRLAEQLQIEVGTPTPVIPAPAYPGTSTTATPSFPSAAAGAVAAPSAPTFVPPAASAPAFNVDSAPYQAPVPGGPCSTPAAVAAAAYTPAPAYAPRPAYQPPASSSSSTGSSAAAGPAFPSATAAYDPYAQAAAPLGAPPPYSAAPPPYSAATAGGGGGDQAVIRLTEMGFERHKILQALKAHNGDEQAALNSLLSGT